MNSPVQTTVHLGRRSLAAPGSQYAARITYTQNIVVATLGTVVEYIDWVVYTVFAPFFAHQFFATTEPTVALLQTLAIFAVGFVTRPIGGAVIGVYADRFGRKRGLTLSIALMALSSAAIGLCPTYASIGVAAPCILLLARLLQGFSAGGQSGAATVFLVESAKSGHRAFAGAWQNIAIVIGVLVASVIGLVLTLVGDTRFLSVWGWRVGFLIAASLGVITFWLRHNTTETAAFTHARQAAARPVAPPAALGQVIVRYPGRILRVLGIACAGNLLFYTWLVSYSGYVHLVTHTPLQTTLTASIVAIVISLIVTPFVGMLADRVGRRPVLMTFAFGSALYSWPSFALLHADMSVMAIILVQTPALLLLSGFNSTSRTAMAEQFPVEVRATGVGVGYAISVALFGGTAPYVFADLHSRGLSGFSWLYVAVMCLISGTSVLLMRETRDDTL